MGPATPLNRARIGFFRNPVVAFAVVAPMVTKFVGSSMLALRGFEVISWHFDDVPPTRRGEVEIIHIAHRSGRLIRKRAYLCGNQSFEATPFRGEVLNARAHLSG